MVNSSRKDIECSDIEEEFIARGRSSRDRARITGVYGDADLVVDRLQVMAFEAIEERGMICSWFLLISGIRLLYI